MNGNPKNKYEGLSWQNIVFATLILVFVVVAILWAKFQWDWCREAGLSFWYCIKQVGA